MQKYAVNNAQYAAVHILHIQHVYALPTLLMPSTGQWRTPGRPGGPAAGPPPTPGRLAGPANSDSESAGDTRVTVRVTSPVDSEAEPPPESESKRH